MTKNMTMDNLHLQNVIICRANVRIETTLVQSCVFSEMVVYITLDLM